VAWLASKIASIATYRNITHYHHMADLFVCIVLIPCGVSKSGNIQFTYGVNKLSENLIRGAMEAISEPHRAK
jgi:hypothetical protein